jgi:hypothetical protein
MGVWVYGVGIAGLLPYPEILEELPSNPDRDESVWDGK